MRYFKYILRHPYVDGNSTQECKHLFESCYCNSDMQSENFVFCNSLSLLVLIELFYGPQIQKWMVKILLALSKMVGS